MKMNMRILHFIHNPVNVLRVIFACSAGGTGVLLNVDRVAELLEGLGHTGIQVRGLSDSGWFLDNKQYQCTDCVDTVNCGPTETIKRGIKYKSQRIYLQMSRFLDYFVR